jgi:nitrogenase molybdenum-iron protein beta chain
MKPRETSRTQCAFQGALAAVSAIGGVVPVVHANAGCALQGYFAGNLANGGQGAGRIGGLGTPSTNVVEKHIVFGGSARLREQIKNTVKVIDGQLYVVISGCTPNLVGDDSKAMADEIKDQGFPSAYVFAPGFHGSAYTGYQSAVKSIVDHVSTFTHSPIKQTKGLVNIFGLAPGQDSFWQGDLLQLSNDLLSVGLTPNPLFGYGQSLQNWKQIPEAELNLVLSSWGIDIAEELNERFGTPYIRRGYLPIGAEETAQLIADISQKIFVNEELRANSAAEAERYNEHFVGQFAEAYFNFGFQSEFSIAGPSSQAIGISRFLAYTLGLTPKTIVITDEPVFKGEPVEEILPHIEVKPEVVFSDDRQEITALLKKGSPELILGSSLDKEAADSIGAAHLSLSFPISDRIIINRGYAGYHGGLNLAEDIGSALINRKH